MKINPTHYQDQIKIFEMAGCGKNWGQTTEQMRRMGLEDVAIILEPEGRNTAPAIALVVLHAVQANRAETYLNSGDYLWNSGMFMYRAQKYIEALERFQPDIIKTCKAAMENGSQDLIRCLILMVRCFRVTSMPF